MDFEFIQRLLTAILTHLLVPMFGDHRPFTLHRHRLHHISRFFTAADQERDNALQKSQADPNCSSHTQPLPQKKKLSIRPLTGSRVWPDLQLQHDLGRGANACVNLASSGPRAAGRGAIACVNHTSLLLLGRGSIACANHASSHLLDRGQLAEGQLLVSSCTFASSRPPRRFTTISRGLTRPWSKFTFYIINLIHLLHDTVVFQLRLMYATKFTQHARTFALPNLT